jgi:hypothetical protein
MVILKGRLFDSNFRFLTISQKQFEEMRHRTFDWWRDISPSEKVSQTPIMSTRIGMQSRDER